MTIDIKSPKARFHLEINDKISIIRGLSATHKSKMLDATESSGPAYKVEVSKSGYTVVALKSKTWELTMAGAKVRKTKHVYIVDDADFVGTKAFADEIKEDKVNYYIIINRIDKTLSFGVNAIYKMENNGKDHYLRNYYNLSYITRLPKNSHFIVEGVGSDLTWWSEIVKDCESAGSNTKVSKVIETYHRCNIYLAVDLFGLGPHIDGIIDKAHECNLNLFFLKDYGSFEYLLLRSNMFNYHLTEDDILKFMTKEDACTDVLEDLTRGQLYSYGKEISLKECYYKDCCTMNRKHLSCDKGMSGNKLTALLKGTEFEYILSLIDGQKGNALLSIARNIGNV